MTLINDDDSSSTELLDINNLEAVYSKVYIQLTLTTGPDRGRVFKVFPLQEVIIGRSHTAGICIDGKGVSRQHAKIDFAVAPPVLSDLGSKNGIVVDGQRVEQLELGHDTVFSIGSCEFKCETMEVAHEEPKLDLIDPKKIAEFNAQLRSEVASKSQRDEVLTGNLAMMNITALLQVLDSNESSGMLLIMCDQNMGEIWLEDGLVLHAKYGGTEGRKAFNRMAALKKGKFEFHSHVRPPKHTIGQRVQELLLDALREADELPSYMDSLPDLNTTLHFNENVAVCLNKIPKFVFELFAVISDGGTIQSIIDTCDQSDVEICRTLLILLNQHILKMGKPNQPNLLDSKISLALQVDELKNTNQIPTIDI